MAVYQRATRSIRCVVCPSPALSDVPVEESVDHGTAGRSARREHERRIAKREADIRQRWGNRLGGVVLAVTSEPQSTRAWARGAAGEEKLAAALADVPGIVTLHDRRVPGTPGNIDHLIVAPAGLFVVDAKHYRGLIRIRDKGGLLRTDERLYVGSRDCSHLAENLGWQVNAVTRALVAADVPDAPQATPVLCFVDAEWPLLFPPKAYRGVLLESERSIRKRLTTAQRLAPERVAELGALLARALPAK